MATLEARLNALATAIGTDIKALKLADGDLTALATTAKGNLVAAINEIFQLAGTAPSGDVTAQDLVDAISALRDELRGGVGGAMDTFKELEDYLSENAAEAAALASAIANRLRFDEAQALTTQQKTTALTNIGAVAASDIGNPDADLVAVYVAAKV